jgi:3-mercaptopyruvate sulfurtransferase SseA
MAKKKKRQNNSMPLLLLVFGGLLVLGVVGWYAWQSAQPAPTPEPPPVQVESPQEVTRLSLEDSKAAFDQKTAIFLDVRDAGSYASSHIPGALSIPLSELPDRLDELDPSAWIITYCT